MATQQYYPFGMLMPTSTDSSLRRQYSLNAYDYRYGFNGKEGDDEIKGDDNQQDYGMRIYDPRVGRFLSVDPIAAQYPWYTPYQFAGNMPIWAVDLDGLEPAFSGNDGQIEVAADQKNNNNYAWTWKGGTWNRGMIEVVISESRSTPQTYQDYDVNTIYTKAARVAFNQTGGEKAFANNHCEGVFLSCSELGFDPIDIANTPSGLFHTEWTYMNNFYVVNSDVSKTENEWINLLIGHFIKGSGPENWIFPTNHQISSFIKNSLIVDVALQEYVDALSNNSINSTSTFHSRPEFGRLVIPQIIKDKDATTLAHFTGSADITIQRVTNSTDILVRVYNVTSYVSGALGKEVNPPEKWPDGRPRNPYNPAPYTNTLQIFQFTISNGELSRRTGGN